MKSFASLCEAFDFSENPRFRVKDIGNFSFEKMDMGKLNAGRRRILILYFGGGGLQIFLVW